MNGRNAVKWKLPRMESEHAAVAAHQALACIERQSAGGAHYSSGPDEPVCRTNGTTIRGVQEVFEVVRCRLLPLRLRRR
jgi:hypothetical protein